MGTIMDFKNIMQHGLVIFHDDNNTVTVKKIATPTSPTDVLHDEVSPDCSTKSFSLYDEAVTFCERFCESGIEEANLRECTVQLAYNPTGFALKVKNLENVKAASPEEAERLGEEQVKTYFKEIGLNKKVDYELKVRPA